MKNLLILSAALFLYSTSAISQSVTLTDLINQNNTASFPSFDKYVAANNFCYDSADSTNAMMTIHTYGSCEFIKDGPDGISIKDEVFYIVLNKTRPVGVKLNTASKTYYQQLLNELKTMEFTSYETGQEGTSTLYKYKSAKYPKILLTQYNRVVKEELSGRYYPYWEFAFTFVN